MGYLALRFTVPLSPPYFLQSSVNTVLLTPSRRLITTTTTTSVKATGTTMNYFFSSSSSSSAESPSTMNHKTKEKQKDQKEEEEKLKQVLKYHNQTKHSFFNYAKGPHGLDWANQPNPFRRYLSAPLLPLLHFPTEDINSSASDTDTPLYSSLYKSLPPPKPISHSTISQFFYDSLALSAWKTAGFSTWSLRVNPSSGNLHPTETYLIAPAIQSVSNSGFVAHYAPKEHSLELRANIPSDFFPKFFPENSFLVGTSSIFWREAWKYGERAFRYCNHDVGHAIAAVTIAAAELGWDVKLLDGLGFEDLEKLMGLDVYPEFQIPSRPVKGKMSGIEFEHPDCVLLVYPNGINQFDVNYKELSSAIREFPGLEWTGKPNALSKEHMCWDIIYKTAETVKKPLTIENGFSVDPFESSGVCGEDSYKDYTMREVVRKRRSAVDMDGITKIERKTFYQILLHCMPSGSRSGEKQKMQLALPFRALSWDAEVHAALFVHRVEGLPRGVYFLVRNEDHFEELKKSMNPDFRWEKPEACPDDLPLYMLAKGDCQQVAKRLSCTQVYIPLDNPSVILVSSYENAISFLLTRKPFSATITCVGKQAGRFSSKEPRDHRIMMSLQIDVCQE